MKVIEQHILRGPNIYSLRPCFTAIIDLENLDDKPSTIFPLFTKKLCELMPTLYEHHCSLGHHGGFIQRLEEGTYMGHIVEHVLIELQCLVGSKVNFGKTRAVPNRPGHYKVICAYEVEQVVSAALPIAIDIVTSLCHGDIPNVPHYLKQLRAIAEKYELGPSTRAIIKAARQRGIPYFRLVDDAHLFQLGWGTLQKRIQATITSATNHIAVEIASDKELTKKLLEEAGLPVPHGKTVKSVEQAILIAASMQQPVTIKPLDSNQGKGVTTQIKTPEEVYLAFERAQAYSSQVIMEEFIQGQDYRVLVVNDQVVAAARRLPPQVQADGVKSIRELVEIENQNPLRGNGHCNVLTKIPLDDTALESLIKQGYDSFDCVPGPGVTVRLRGNANLSTGGIAEDVTDSIHPDIGNACLRAAQTIGLDIAGIDLICDDITKPLEVQGGKIIEINAAPGIRMHEHPVKGEKHHAGEAIVNALFPNSNGRIPVIAVTGTNGKTTTTLLIGHVIQGAGITTGIATTEGAFINRQIINKGDCTGYWSARMLLASPEIETAVLETARGGILKRGLGFDRCDVAVILNVDKDHLGQDGIETLEQLADVKQLLAEVATKAVVLNAQDPRCVAMKNAIRPGVEIIYFSLDPANEVLHQHLDREGRAVYVDKTMLILGHGHHRIPLVETKYLPFTLAGKAQHNVANALASVATLWASGFSRRRIVSGLMTFTSNVEENPLRLNIFDVRGITVILDYAHNKPAYEAIIETARAFSPKKLVGVISAPGDRRDAELEEIGQLCVQGFDEVIVYEIDEWRGRPVGETAEILLKGMIKSGLSANKISSILDVRAATRRALDICRPGDVLVIGCASTVEDLTDLIADDTKPVKIYKMPQKKIMDVITVQTANPIRAVNR